MGEDSGSDFKVEAGEEMRRALFFVYYVDGTEVLYR